MSQSDYINHKKQATVLRRQQDLDSILSSHDYTKYKSFELANTIDVENKNPTYNQLQLDNKERVFNMELTVSGCARFQLCSDTADLSNRPNRKITMTDSMGKRGMATTGLQGYNEYKVNQKVNNLIMPCMMFDKCDTFLYNRRNMNKMVNIEN